MIFIVGYPYVGERHRRVFDFFNKKDDLVLILPEVWKMKGGKVVMKADSLANESGLKIIPEKTRFFNSNHPIVKGHLKGWMPATKKILKEMARPGDILYSVSEPNLFVTYLYVKIAKKLNLKHIFFTWQNVPYKSRLSGLKLKLTEWLIKKNIALSSGVICGNIKALEVIKPYLPDNFPHLVAPVSGMDTEKFRPGIASDFRAKYDLENKTIVLFVGAIDNRKGIFKLVDAFVEAKKKEDSLHLVIIGSGPLDKELENYVRLARSDKDIIILSWIDNKDLPGYFANSDIFVYPSQPYGGWEEQFGYSIAEASSSGLPVISTKTGSIGDIVIDGKTGVLIDSENIAGLSRAIWELAQDKNLRDTMGYAGREFVTNNFSHQIIADKLENFLRNI